MGRQRSANVADALENLLGGMESSARVRENLSLAYWDKVVGAQAAAATEAESVKEGVLFVRTKSSVWSHELTFLKSTILEKLNQRIGRPVIREIIFRAQGVKKSPPPEGPAHPTEEEIAAVVLLPGEQKALDSELRKIARIREEGIRLSVRRRVIREFRLNRWRLENGWSECERCRAVHPLAESLCPLCKIAMPAIHITGK
jgi:predicted nucleic acid-binding Zn ribbon protein